MTTESTDIMLILRPPAALRKPRETHRLKSFLKRLGRAYGFQCRAARALSEPPQAAFAVATLIHFRDHVVAYCGGDRVEVRPGQSFRGVSYEQLATLGSGYQRIQADASVDAPCTTSTTGA